MKYLLVILLVFVACKQKGFKMDVSKAEMGLEEVKYESDSTAYIINEDTFYNYSTISDTCIVVITIDTCIKIRKNIK